MQAQEKSLVEFLQGKHQLVIPIYQRPYSWTNKQLEQLWQDIINISQKENQQHFLGSIVRIKPRIEIREISEQAIIDGQQRITSIFILISAIVRHFSSPRDEEVKENYLINKHAQDRLHYKLWSTDTDRQTLNDLITNNPHCDESSERVIFAFNFFSERIEKENIDPEYLLRGIRQLVIVDICLDPERDNPQLIFESLNSTGLSLSQSDLIRNFILMDRSPQQQEALYRNYWHKMECHFDHIDRSLFDRFIRDYLTIQNYGKIPRIGDIYTTFKKWVREQQNKNIEELIAHIYQYSIYFIKMTNPQIYETDLDLQQMFMRLKELKVDVAFPFLLLIYHDYQETKLNKTEFLKILKLIESYVLRRSICDIPTNALNKIFANLYSKISLNRDEYIESLEIALCNLEGNQRFPKNSELTQALQSKPLYISNNASFILKQIEKYQGGKEPVITENLTIEHIMPQELNEEWEKQLGPDWQHIHETYLHTIGNLTLTGYNSEMGNKSFAEKKALVYEQSPLYLNKQLKNTSIWREEQILERTQELTKIILEIWQRPSIS